MKLRFKILVTLALALMIYDTLNPNMFGFLKNRTISISLILCLIFIVLNFDKIFKINYNIREVIFGIILFVMIAIGYLECYFIYNKDYSGYLNSINTVVGFLVLYLSFKIYFFKMSKNIFDKTIKMILFSSFSIFAFFGVIEIIYGYLFKTVIIKNFLVFFLFHGIDYIGGGRIHFTIQEPSFVSTYTYLLLVSCCIYMLNYSNDKNKGKYKVILVTSIFMSFFSLSNRFFIDSIVFLVVIIFNLGKKLNVKNRLKILSLIMVFCIIGIILFNNNIKNNSNVQRISSVIAGNSFNTDNSSIVRNQLINIGIKGFIQKPFLGWGFGNYKYCFISNFQPVDNILANNELINDLQNSKIKSYSFYVTFANENGILGIICIFMLISICMKNNYSKKPLFKIIGIMILYQYIQGELLGPIPIIMWLAIFNTKIEGVN